MKRIYVVAGIILILGATYAIEWYTNTRFPAEEVTRINLPELEIGVTRTFSYTREMEKVGTHSYTVTIKEDGRYTLVSNTDVSYEGNRLQLDSIFIFDENYTPEDYRLKADQEGEISHINVTITGNQIVSTISFSNETVVLTDDYSEGIVFTENNMPGLWELLLLSSDMEKGGRYAVDAYIPQGGAVFDLEFYVSPNTKTINIDGQQLSCTLIQESTLDLRFYFYENRLVEMRNDDQDLTFTLID